MKWALDQIKSALREKAQRRSVKELVQSGARSVRVISEDEIFQLIQAVVTDTLGSQAGMLGAEDRERIVSQAKERLDRVLRQNTLAENRSRRQQETILTYQRQLERLERERVALLEKTRVLHEREARSREDATDTATALADARAEIEVLRRELEAAQAARDDAVRQGSEAAEETLSAMRAELGDLKSALAGLSERQPHGLDPSQLDDVIARLARQEADATRTLEERFARSMDQVLEQVGRTLRAATAKPIDRPVEATEVMLTKVFERESDMESNIGDLGVSERSSQRGIDRSLERLREARRGGAAVPTGDDAAPGPAADANGTVRKRAADRRKGGPDRRRSGASRPAASERRKSARDRRKPAGKDKASGRDGAASKSRRKS
jgi:chromosome segregation ATPase